MSMIKRLIEIYESDFYIRYLKNHQFLFGTLLFGFFAFFRENSIFVYWIFVFFMKDKLEKTKFYEESPVDENNVISIILYSASIICFSLHMYQIYKKKKRDS